MKYVLTLEKFDLEVQYNKFNISPEIRELINKEYPNAMDKFKLWLSRQVDGNPREFIERNKSKITGILDYMSSPFRQGKIDFNLSLEQMNDKQEEWHEELAKSSKFITEEKNKIIKDYGNGYYWVDLQKNECEEEAKMMGHCGSDGSVDTLLSLRFKHNTGHIEGILTAGYKDGVIYQLKGRGNSKPLKKYHPYIISLFLDDFIKVDKKQMSGYKPEIDFQFDDLTDKELNIVFNKKPSLKENFYMDMFAMTGKDKYLNILKEDKEFKEKYDKWVKWFKDNFTMKINVDENNPEHEFFFNKNGEVRMENSHEYETLYVDYDDIWKKINRDFDDKRQYTNKLIQSMVGEVFKIRPSPTSPGAIPLTRIRWERYSK